VVVPGQDPLTAHPLVLLQLRLESARPTLPGRHRAVFRVAFGSACRCGQRGSETIDIEPPRTRDVSGGWLRPTVVGAVDGLGDERLFAEVWVEGLGPQPAVVIAGVGELVV
jgi:hypothetical protein